MLRTYCQKPGHRYSTRYKTSENYVLPCSATNRGQRSIKYTGPKAWAEVPNQFKEIAFRKPFSKKHKEYILNQTHVDLPPKRKNTIESIAEDPFDLNLLFETDDEDVEFFGFDLSAPNINNTAISELRQLFNASSSDEDFAGFTNASRNSDLDTLFLNNSSDSDFPGF